MDEDTKELIRLGITELARLATAFESIDKSLAKLATCVEESSIDESGTLNIDTNNSIRFEDGAELTVYLGMGENYYPIRISQVDKISKDKRV